MLLFFTAVDGGEQFLDALVPFGVGTVPFEDRMALRGRIHLPQVIWRRLSEVLRRGSSEAQPREDSADLAEVIQCLVDGISDITSAPPVSRFDFKWERVDIVLDLEQDGAGGMDIPIGVTPFHSDGGIHSPTAPPAPLAVGDLARTVRTRIAQVSSEAEWGRYLIQCRFITRRYIQEVMQQVWYAFIAKDHGGGNSGDTELGPIVFPEAVLPLSERRTVEDYVRDRGRPALIGSIWRALHTVYMSVAGECPPVRFLVNEAILTVPLETSDESAPTLVRSFIVRKPIPAHSEDSLARVLTNRCPHHCRFEMLPGARWYRFVHPKWGDFSVAICSDLLDPTPWVSMRGQLLHLFMSAFNPDVDLYEALTWVRGYETYINVVQTNHGSVGGSFAWTPKHDRRKELAKMRGADMFLIADFDLPVTDLIQEQNEGKGRAMERMCVYRAKPTTDSDTCRPLIPGDADHPLRSHAVHF